MQAITAREIILRKSFEEQKKNTRLPCSSFHIGRRDTERMMMESKEEANGCGRKKTDKLREEDV